MKIAAIVILYNPDILVLQNIQSYANSVDLLCIVDNSTIHNEKLIDTINSNFSNAIYINNTTNLGIATALNIGCDKALEHSCDWVLTMDQDSKFINFKHYIECLNQLKNKNQVALLASNTMRDAEKCLPVKATCQYEEKFLVITSGNLLNLSLFNKIGRFEDKLFIDMVDYDYCLKVNSLGYKIYYFKDVLVEHNVGELLKRKNIFTRKIRNKIEHNPQRNYYKTRNFLYISNKYSNKFPKKINLIKAINILFIHEITKILLYEDKKLNKIIAKVIALYHFTINKYGKYTI